MRFAIREGGKTVGAGIVTKILGVMQQWHPWPTTKIRIRLKAFDHQLLDKSASEIVETAKRTGARVAGPIPLPTQINALHGAARTARRQEVARAVRDPHAQAPARHPRAHAADPRRADEARPVRRRRRRDQDAEGTASMAKLTVVQHQARTGRARSTSRTRSSAHRSQRAPLLRGREGAARLAARGHHATKDRSAVAGLDEEALQAEGHRQRAPRHHPRADLRRRRQGPRAAAAQTRPTGRRGKVRVGALRQRALPLREGGPPRSSSTRSRSTP